jgi:peptidoglycan/xylan/chitin deacetylase (PgdA/CDA1 family)
MPQQNTWLTQKVLSGINYSGLGKLYQQVGGELGMILTLHHVRSEQDAEFAPNAHLSVTPEFLEETIKFLRKREYALVSIDEARKRILSGDRSSRFAAFTFDDGYRNTSEIAAPIMRKYAVPYVVYFATGFVDRTVCNWWEGLELAIGNNNELTLKTSGRSKTFACNTIAEKYNAYDQLVDIFTSQIGELEQANALRSLCSKSYEQLIERMNNEMMAWNEIKALKDDPLCTIGAHSIDHHALARLDEAKAAKEIEDGTALLHQHLGTRPKHFAYPYGYRSAAGPREFELVRNAGFETGVTTRPGLIFPEHSEHLTALPRVSINGLYQKGRYFSALTSGLPTRLIGRNRKLNVS